MIFCNPSLVERFLKEKSTPSWVSGVTSNIDNPLLVASQHVTMIVLGYTVNEIVTQSVVYVEPV